MPTIKTINCLEHRYWRDENAKNDALNGHAPHVFRMGWRKRAYRCRGSKRPVYSATLDTMIIRWLNNRNISIAELIKP